MIFRKAQNRLKLENYSFYKKKLGLKAGSREILAGSGLSRLDYQNLSSARGLKRIGLIQVGRYFKKANPLWVISGFVQT